MRKRTLAVLVSMFLILEADTASRFQACKTDVHIELCGLRKWDRPQMLSSFEGHHWI
jgi:hypothetical protein